jgi:tripartite-type tricarboxylate transporter receptor subunit TctC
MFRAFSFAILVALAVPASILADEYPNRMITLVVPFAAGGQADSFGRIIGEGLRKTLKQPVVVENRVGAGGMLGTEAVVRAAPDGYTLVVGVASNIATQPLFSPNLRFDVEHDLAPVALAAASPMLLVVRADSPYKTTADLIEAGRKKDLSYGSSGLGSSMHLGTEWLLNSAKIKATHVPFRGSAQSIPALLSGDIDFLLDPPITAYPLVEAKQLRALAVTVRTADQSFASIPTLAESGFPGFEQRVWAGVLAPAATPPDVIAKIEAAIREIVTDPAVSDRLSKAGLPVFYRDAKGFASLLQEDISRYRKVISDAGLAPAK